MVFSSSIFLYWFLPLFLFAYFAMPRRWRSVWIALASYVFYGWWRPDFVLLMLFSTVVDYVAGERIVRARERERPGAGRRWVFLSCLSNLGLLGYFKYANFGVESLNEILRAQGMESVSWTEVVLPVGISFYTFQTMSYTIDVYRGHAEKVRRFVDFMAYVALFPQLVAGPIVRYQTVAEQLRSRHRESFEKFSRGVLLFQIGLAKKVLIADQLGPVADAAFGAEALGLGEAWIGLLAYTFQIYFDFSGYSDMAIGLGLLIGFTFPINFDQPYRAVGVTDFWRRWHISLSTWLRDYLYIPLGGNRKGSVRTYVNLALVMLLGGLWHGAAWTFIAWGAWQGFWLIVERGMGKKSIYRLLPGPWPILSTFLLTMCGWVFFRATDIASAGRYFQDMVGLHGFRAMADLPVDALVVTVFLAGAGAVWLFPTSQKLVARPRLLFTLLLQVLFLLALLQLHHAQHVPFLYFQF